MSLTLSTGKSTEIELVGGDFVRWKDISRRANEKACKPWAQLVTGGHEKYGVDGEWLNKQTIDGDVAFDTSDLTPGDYIKVSGASHSNKKNAYYQVDSVDDSLTITRVSESDVLESVRNNDDLDEISDVERVEHCPACGEKVLYEPDGNKVYRCPTHGVIIVNVVPCSTDTKMPHNDGGTDSS